MKNLIIALISVSGTVFANNEDENPVQDPNISVETVCAKQLAVKKEKEDNVESDGDSPSTVGEAVESDMTREQFEQFLFRELVLRIGTELNYPENIINETLLQGFRDPRFIQDVIASNTHETQTQLTDFIGNALRLNYYRPIFANRVQLVAQQHPELGTAIYRLTRLFGQDERYTPRAAQVLNLLVVAENPEILNHRYAMLDQLIVIALREIAVEQQALRRHRVVSMSSAR